MTILPLGQDLHFHVYRIGAMAEELRLAPLKIPIRILSASFNNYGYGVPLFYGDFLLYIPAFLVVLGLSEQHALQLLIVAILWLSFLAMKSQIFRVTKKSDFAMASAFIYVCSSYFLIDLCIRMAIGEASAFIFLPFAFCSFYSILYRQCKSDWLYLCFGMSGLLLCHNITFVFVCVILFVWALIKIKVLITNQGILKILFAAVLAIGLSASFIFPMLEAMTVQKYQVTSNNEYQIAEFISYAPEWIDFFLPYEIKKIINQIFNLSLQTEYWTPGGIGILWLFTVIADLRIQAEGKNKVLQIFFYIGSIIYIALFIKPVISLVSKFLAFMQFGWRLYTFSTFIFSIYLAYILSYFFKAKLKSLTFILVALLSIYTIGPRYAYQIYLNIQGMDYIESVNPEFYEHYDMSYSPNDGDNMYLPEGVNWYLFQDRGDACISNNADVELSFARINNHCEITVKNNSYTDTTVELPLYFYKGYTAYDISTGKTFEISKSENGLVQLEIYDANDLTIDVFYKGTFIQSFSDLLSIISLIGFIVFAIHYRRLNV